MKRSTLFLAVLLFAGAAAADELILHDGKVIRGKIVEESATQIRIRTGPQMNLAFEKEQIRAVKRSSPRPAAPVEKPAPRPEAEAVVSSAPVNPVRQWDAGTVETSAKKKAVSLRQLVVTSTYAVPGASFERISQEILKAAGAAAPTGLLPIDAGQRGFDVSWTGKVERGERGMKWADVTIESKVSLRVPRWEAPAQPDPAALARWNEFVGEVERHNAGHMGIFKSAVDSLAQGLTSLRADDEAKLRARSATLEAAIRERVRKRQEGFDRHAVRERENPISRKKK